MEKKLNKRLPKSDKTLERNLKNIYLLLKPLQVGAGGFGAIIFVFGCPITVTDHSFIHDVVRRLIMRASICSLYNTRDLRL